MATPVADRAVLDTNVLLAASDEGRLDHDRSLAALNGWPATGMVLYTSGQILREYLVVATRPMDRNGLGMARLDAVANVRRLQTRLTLLAGGRNVTDRLLDLLGAVDCSGKQVHDANIVATMLVHGIDTVITNNVADFAVFAAQRPGGRSVRIAHGERLEVRDRCGHGQANSAGASQVQPQDGVMRWSPPPHWDTSLGPPGDGVPPLLGRRQRPG